MLTTVLQMADTWNPALTYSVQQVVTLVLIPLFNHKDAYDHVNNPRHSEDLFRRRFGKISRRLSIGSVEQLLESRSEGLSENLGELTKPT